MDSKILSKFLPGKRFKRTKKKKQQKSTLSSASRVTLIMKKELERDLSLYLSWDKIRYESQIFLLLLSAMLKKSLAYLL